MVTNIIELWSYEYIFFFLRNRGSEIYRVRVSRRNVH